MTCVICRKEDRICCPKGTKPEYFNCIFCKEGSCLIHDCPLKNCFCYCSKCFNVTESKNNMKFWDLQINYDIDHISFHILKKNQIFENLDKFLKQRRRRRLAFHPSFSFGSKIWKKSADSEFSSRTAGWWSESIIKRTYVIDPIFNGPFKTPNWLLHPKTVDNLSDYGQIE